MVKFGTRVQVWESLPHAKFCKNSLRDIPLWCKFIRNITNFGDDREIWLEGADLRRPPLRLIL